MSPIYPNIARPSSSTNTPALTPLTLADGYRTWVLVHKPHACNGLPVLLLHGIQSHPAWFILSAEALSAAGHPVYQLMRRGSGINERDRGHARSPGQLLADLDTALDYMLRCERADRAHLAGVSWGGKLAVAYALQPRRQAKLAGLVLAAPGIVPRVDVPAPTKLAIAVCALLAPRRRFAIPLNEPELFTDTPALRQYIADDPHRLRRATARFLLSSRLLDRRLAAAPVGALRLGVKLLLAKRDRIIDNDATRAVLERLAGSRLTVRTFDAAHTLEFEPDPSAVHAALVEAVRANESGPPLNAPSQTHRTGTSHD